MKNDSSSANHSGTINIGIDLGTTNSEVAINIDNDVEVVKSGPGQPEYTPSVFGINKAGNKIVGQQAYDKLFKSASDEEFANNKAEVKRLMGTAETIQFQRLSLSLTPEEVSAEILKSLKENITRKYPEYSTTAAVITIPAHFSSLQAEATKRAGLLAGFKHVVLLQEPIAAAVAYGFDNSENQNWIVYDLGGGTFDVALISSKDGILTVLGHNGDNFLGGKDFDLKIIDEIIKPGILEKFKFKNFDRSNEKYKSTFARLKALAEAAKIELSQYDKTTIEVEDIGLDDAGNEVYVSIDLTRSRFEDLIRPLVTKTIDLAKKTLSESGVQSSAISKIVLVGGPTQIPFIRKSLEKEFNLSVDVSVDPLTVVARGACVYGLSQRIPQDLLMEEHATDQDELAVELNYDAMTSEDEQTITGKIDSLKDSNDDYFVQIQSDSGFYSSSKIRLKNGKFFDVVAVEKGKTNTYWLYLFNKEGNTVPIFPDSFSVTHGLTVSGAPIPHSVGVIYAKKGFDNNFQFTEVCDPYFEKGSIPPLEETRTYKTARKLVKGQDNGLPIKVYEGESSNPENNTITTRLKIDGDKLPYDLPEGTEVDITIRKDPDMSTFVEIYIPSIELTLDARADTYTQAIDTKKLSVELETQKERLKKVEDDISSDEQSKLEETIDTLETNIKNAENDTDDRNKAERDLKELKQDLDKIEQDRTIPQLSDEFHEKVHTLQESLDNIEDEAEQTRLKNVLDDIKKEGEKAIQNQDKDLLIRLNEQLQHLITAILLNDPAVWIYWFNDIKQRKDELTNQQVANYHIEKAQEAIDSGDVDELRRHVRNLIDLLPDEAKEEIEQEISGITR